MTVNCVMLLVEIGWVNTQCVNIFICYLVTFLLVCIPFLRCLLYSEKHIGVSPYRTSKWHTTQKSFSNVILLQGVVLLKFLFITRTAPYIISTDNILFNFCKKMWVAKRIIIEFYVASIITILIPNEFPMRLFIFLEALLYINDG